MTGAILLAGSMKDTFDEGYEKEWRSLRPGNQIVVEWEL
jgi:hypothetical protein